MDAFILIVKFILVLAYIGFAIYFIWRSQTGLGSFCSLIGFTSGGLIVVPLATLIATFISYAVVIIISLFVLIAIFQAVE